MSDWENDGTEAVTFKPSHEYEVRAISAHRGQCFTFGCEETTTKFLLDQPGYRVFYCGECAGYLKGKFVSTGGLLGSIPVPIEP